MLVVYHSYAIICTASMIFHSVLEKGKHREKHFMHLSKKLWCCVSSLNASQNWNCQKCDWSEWSSEGFHLKHQCSNIHTLRQVTTCFTFGLHIRHQSAYLFQYTIRKNLLPDLFNDKIKILLYCMILLYIVMLYSML